jgi:hypothetical protein
MLNLTEYEKLVLKSWLKIIIIFHIFNVIIYYFYSYNIIKIIKKYLLLHYG